MRKQVGVLLLSLIVVALVLAISSDVDQIRDSLRVEGISLQSSRQNIVESGWKLSQSSKEDSSAPVFVKKDASLVTILKGNKAVMLQGQLFTMKDIAIRAGATRTEIKGTLGKPDRQTYSRIDNSPVDSFDYSSKLGLAVFSLRVSYDKNEVVRNFAIYQK